MMASLVAAVVVLALCCLALLGCCIWLFRRQRQQAQLQAREDAARDKRIKELAARLDTYLDGSVRIGKNLHELSRVVAPLPERLTQLEQRDPNNFTFSQAAKLIGMGASDDDLTQSCGLSQSEAELMRKLYQARRKPN
ncbi:DUF2802 domain-containing protein [Pseudomonas stutzeri]|uniref:DUF2802 domain-containing protein n=1 Tax=Stutzerimonas stutzeri TaxID=316 RepID=UPI002108F5DA|nr:DUF2802 domain-containing protein [Stutzerimonas stutzeri]MCQ4286311.1 DUF2802 domain-containing protein [Stutzerimonas stutzeri]